MSFVRISLGKKYLPEGGSPSLSRGQEKKCHPVVTLLDGEEKEAQSRDLRQ